MTQDKLNSEIHRLAMNAARSKADQFNRILLMLHRIEISASAVCDLTENPKHDATKLADYACELAGPYAQAANYMLRIEAECEARLELPPTKRTRHWR